MALVYIKRLSLVLLFCCTLQARTIVVFAPHPDDDILGCGGAIAHHIKQGDKVCVVFVTSGEKGSNKKLDKEQLAQQREFEAVQAQKILGCHTCIFLRNADSKLQVSKETIHQILTCLQKYAADCVYIPHKDDNHKDHKKTYQIVYAALQLLLEPLPVVYCYEVWTPLQKINRIENISDVMALKLLALQQHRTQLRSLSYDKAIEGLNRYRGIMSRKGATYAECFYKLSEAEIFSVLS